MSVEGKIEYDGEVWNYVYINPDGILGPEDRRDLLWNVVDMKKRGVDSRELRGEYYEGKLKMGKKSLLGSFFGTRVDGFVESNKGKSKLSILLIDPVKWWDN